MPADVTEQGSALWLPLEAVFCNLQENTAKRVEVPGSQGDAGAEVCRNSSMLSRSSYFNATGEITLFQCYGLVTACFPQSGIAGAEPCGSDNPDVKEGRKEASDKWNQR